MPEIINEGAEIRLDKDERQKLGKEFNLWIEGVEDSRRRLMQETWIKALDNYEGKEPIKQFPWPGASNAFLPMTGTHADALGARLFNAAIAHDPAYLILPNRTGFLIEEGDIQVTFDMWARWWQNISKHIERVEVPLKELMEEVILTFVIYGDAFVYLPWEKEEVMDVSFNVDTRTVERNPRTLLNAPRPRVLHPKDVYLNWGDKDVQTARRVGIGWDLDASTLDEFHARGMYDDESHERLSKLLENKEKEDEAKLAALNSDRYYKEWGGTFFTPDEFEKQVKRRVGIDEGSGRNTIRMVRVFTRADLDGDGIPEETVFDVARDDGTVPLARYANLLHRKRPIVQYIYNNRPGSIYNRGVPELLFNIQKILNTTLRDHLDNNKVQNTKMFLAKKGSPIEENAQVYPSRVFFVDDIETDFKAVDLGTGRPVTDINSIAVIEKWGQFITGITDFNLGQEKRSRTPATTTLALLEEGNKRIDRTIEVMRTSMLDMHKQMLMLYFQNGDSEQLAKIAAIETDEELELFLLAWDSVDPDDVLSSINMVAEVSSSSLNRQSQRQEALALYAQVEAHYQRVTAFANAIGGALADPVMRQLFLLMSKGLARVMGMVLDTFDVKDQEALNPDSIIELLEGVTSVPAGNAATNQAGPSNPAQQASAVAQDGILPTNEGEAPNRPVAGAPRAAGDLVGQ